MDSGPSGSITRHAQYMDLSVHFKAGGLQAKEE